MTRAYFSTTFAQSADKVWSVIRDFNGQQWAEGVGESHIENRKPNNEVGAVRELRYYERPTHQRLTAHSDEERCYSFESVEPFENLRSYRQTLHVAPIVDTNTAFVEWWADFDATEEDRESWKNYLQEQFAKSLEKLRTYLAEQ
jgi:hypothetical protein